MRVRACIVSCLTHASCWGRPAVRDGIGKCNIGCSVVVTRLPPDRLVAGSKPVEGQKIVCQKVKNKHQKLCNQFCIQNILHMNTYFYFLLKIQLLAKHRPGPPIIAMCTNTHVCKHLQIVQGLRCVDLQESCSMVIFFVMPEMCVCGNCVWKLKFFGIGFWDLLQFSLTRFNTFLLKNNCKFFWKIC